MYTAANLLGQALQQNEHQQIVGAGISGLLLGYALKKKGFDFSIVEAGSRGGGILGSVQTPFGIAEKAANGILLTKVFQELCDDIVLEILPPEKVTKNRFLYSKRGPSTMFIPPSSLPRLVYGSIFKKQKDFQTVEEFGLHFLGKTLTYEVLETGLQGIFGAAVSELSYKGVMPWLEEAFRENTRLVTTLRSLQKKRKGDKPKGTHGFAGGMQDLVIALEDYLSEHIIYNQEFKVDELKGSTILCIPAYRASAFFPDSGMEKKLQSLYYSSMLTCTNFYERNHVQNFKEGFGCLIPRKYKFDILGVLYNSCIFKNRVNDQEHISLTTIARDHYGEWSDLTDEAAKHKMHRNLERLYSVQGEPLHQELFRWENGIPIYSPALYESWSWMDQFLKQRRSSIRLLGNYTGEISIRGIATALLKKD